ncbi:YwqG family protein [Yoonia sp. 208BN28-4]|uniref:YwqG family protein n=1 Tax=Yoonia sp. 208BN28-4 TaxID=3126505 RepID=UPI0030B455A8
MTNLVFIIFAILLAKALFAIGVAPWVLLLASVLAMLFWHRMLNVIVRGMISLSEVLNGLGLPGGPALLAAARWLTGVEGVRTADGGWMDPSDMDVAVRAEALRAQQGTQAAAQRAEAAQDKAQQKAQATALRAEAEAIFDAQAEDAIFLIKAKQQGRASGSKIGGRPTLPPGKEWPEHYGMGLHFLAEIHLDEIPRDLAPDALPSSGVLYFFLDIGEYSDLMDGRVLYAPHAGPHRVKRHPNLAKLQRGFVPEIEQDNVLVETAVRAIVAPVPHLNDFDFASVSKELNRSIGDVAKKRFAQALHEKGYSGKQDEDGYVFNMIGGPKLDIPNPTMGQGIKLLQLDSTAGLGLQFGDMGVMEFWIAEEDLRMGRFDRAFVENASC